MVKRVKLRTFAKKNNSKSTLKHSQSKTKAAQLFSLDCRKVHSTFLHKIYCDNEKVQINHVLYLTELRLRVIFYFKNPTHIYI